MNVPAQLHPSDDFVKCIRWSFIAHVILLGLMVLRAAFYPSESIVVQRAIRVDMVGLPEKSQVVSPIPEQASKTKSAEKPTEKAELKPTQVAKKALPEVKNIDSQKLDLRKTKSAEEDALKRLEAFKKLAEMSKASAQNNQAKAAPPAPPIRGDVLAAGAAIGGLNKIDYDSYLEKLDEKVKSNWNLPRLLKNQNLAATIVVYIDGNGNILKKEVKKSSGNSVFDEKCVESVVRSAPFDPPPLKLSNILAVDGIELGFPE